MRNLPAKTVKKKVGTKKKKAGNCFFHQAIAYALDIDGAWEVCMDGVGQPSSYRSVFDNGSSRSSIGMTTRLSGKNWRNTRSRPRNVRSPS